MRYYIDFGNNVLYAVDGTLDLAKEQADKRITRTQQWVRIIDENKNLIVYREWCFAPYDPATSPYNASDVITFPHCPVGYYAPWQRWAKKSHEAESTEDEPFKTYDEATDTLFVKALSQNYERFCEENNTHNVLTRHSHVYGTYIFAAEPDDDAFDAYCDSIAEHLVAMGWTVEEQKEWMKDLHIYGTTARLVAKHMKQIRANHIHDAIFKWANMWEDYLLEPPTEVKSPDETIYGDVSSTITCDGGVYRWVLTRDGELYKAWYKVSPTDKNIYRLDCHNARLIVKIPLNPEYDGSTRFHFERDTI